MASSRLERIGTVFSRVTSLIRTGVLKKQNVPVWYWVYKAFPPQDEPRFDRPVSEKPIKPIFYEEDIIRAKFHKDVVLLPKINFNSKENTYTQIFLKTYAMYQKDGHNETDAYEKAMANFTLNALSKNK